MKVAVNTIVVLALGLAMFAAGGYLLSDIFGGATETIETMSDQRRNEILAEFPPDEEVYLPQQSFETESSDIRVPFGVYNRYQNNITVNVSVACESCGPSTDVSSVIINHSLSSGERKIMQAVVTNETWNPGQHVLVFTVMNASTGPFIDNKTFYVES